MGKTRQYTSKPPPKMGELVTVWQGEYIIIDGKRYKKLEIVRIWDKEKTAL